MSKVRQPRLGEPVRADSGVDGQLKAAGALSRTVLNPDVQRVLDDYRRLNTDEARARYADHFLSRTAHVMDEIWPTFYELLKRVEDGKLYSDPAYLGEGRTFGTFQEYFEHRVGRPFETWSEMETTYHYARDYAPGLLKKAFGKARDARDAAQQAIQAGTDFLRAKKDGLKINEGAGPLTGEEKANADIISISPGRKFGTNVDYLARRIARDRPDVLERMAAGEFRSVRAAAIEANIAPRTQSVRMDDAESAARAIHKHMPPDTRRALARLLMND